MAARVTPIRAEIEAVWCTTVSGLSIALPWAFVQFHLAQGLRRVPLDDVILDPSAPLLPWLTVTEAAQQHIEDVDGMTIKYARAKISRACDAGQIVSRGCRRERKIEPVSFRAWRLVEREKDLARE